MRNLAITLAVLLAAAGAAFGAFYVMNDAPAIRRAADEGDAMAWLRAEFHLTDAQFAAIKRLHDDYAVVCTRHCRAIVRAKQRQASPAEIAGLERTCVEAMTAHFQQVAALMPPEEGQRYLAIVLPRVAGYDHQRGAPDLRVQP
jgi:hypothetical protein